MKIIIEYMIIITLIAIMAGIFSIMCSYAINTQTMFNNTKLSILRISITDKQKELIRFQDIVNMKYAFNCKKGVECYGRKETEIF